MSTWREIRDREVREAEAYEDMGLVYATRDVIELAHHGRIALALGEAYVDGLHMALDLCAAESDIMDAESAILEEIRDLEEGKVIP